MEDSHSLRNLLRPQFPSSWSVERPPSVVYGVAGVSTAVFIVAFAVARRFALLHSVLGERALDQLRRIAAALSEADRFQRWTDSVWSRPLQRLSERVVDQTLERRFFDHTLGRRLPALLETIAREGVGRANPGRIPFGLVVLILGTGAMLFWVVQ